MKQQTNNTRRVIVYCSVVYSSLGLIRCLGEEGYTPECYCYGADGHYLFKSKYVSIGRQFRTAEEVLDFLINAYPTYEEKPILLTLPDPPAYLVDMHHKELSKKFVLQTAGESGRICYWMDKRNISQLAKKHGFIIPWCIDISKDTKIPFDLDYPVFTKSTTSYDGGKDDEHICQNREELVKAQKQMLSDKLLVMKFIEKKKEINYFGLSIKGNIYIDYHDERDRFPKDGLGYYNTFYLCQHNDIYNRIIEMMKETGYEGLFDVEFLLGKDNVLYFVEVNFRVDGEMYKLSKGVNLPAEWCRLSTMNKDLLPNQLKTKSKKFTGIFEYQDFKAMVLKKQMNPFTWFWQFITADKYSLINYKDPKPFFFWIWDLLKIIIKSHL